MYPSDLTDAQWAVLEPHLLATRESRRGRPIVLGQRRVIDALLYVVKTGCQWRQLPREFGHWMTIYSHYRRLRERGIWDRMLTVLREQARIKAGRNAHPSAAIIDSQSVKTTGKGGSAGSMRARRSKAENATLPLIRKGSCSR